MMQLRRYLRELNPTHLAVMMDEDLAKLERRALYPLYKNDRVGNCPEEPPME